MQCGSILDNFWVTGSGSLHGVIKCNMVATLVVIIINKQIAMANMANVCTANVKLP